MILPLLLNAASALTIIFMVVTLVLEVSGAAPALEGFFRFGLVVAGTSWVALVLRDITGSPETLWLIPSLLFLVFLAPRLFKSCWRGWKNLRLHMDSGWRCSFCGKENERAAPVCYFCQAWRKRS